MFMSILYTILVLHVCKLLEFNSGSEMISDLKNMQTRTWIKLTAYYYNMTIIVSTAEHKY